MVPKTLIRNLFKLKSIRTAFQIDQRVSIVYKSVLTVCRRPYKGHQNQLKYLKFLFSMSPLEELHLREERNN